MTGLRINPVHAGQLEPGPANRPAGAVSRPRLKRAVVASPDILSFRRSAAPPTAGCSRRVCAISAGAARRDRTPGRDRQAGFTLIELLLATALIAIIMAMAYGGFRAGVRATTSGEALIEETNRLRVVHQFIRRQISHARPLIIEQDNQQIIRFEGESERIRFIAPMPGYLGFGGPYVQELRIEQGEAGMDLVFAFAMLNGYEPGDLERDPPVTLLEDIGRADFEFLGYDEDGESVFWSDFWEPIDQVPLSVSLRLAMQRDNGLFFPELVTPVIIDSGGAAPRSVDPADIRAELIGGNRPRNRR